MKRDITEFKERELYPRYFNHLTQILPEFEWKSKRGKYVSNFHADGSEGTGYKEERCVVKENEVKRAGGIWDNTWRKHIPIIDVYMGLHNVDFWQAINDICDIVGISRPEFTPELKAKYEQDKTKRTAFELSAARQKKALFAPEGKAVLDYLHSRGWTDSEIHAAGLGYISEKEYNTLLTPGIERQWGIGSFFTLSIPLHFGDNLYGFKFRTIQKVHNKNDRYRYLNGTEKQLFNPAGIQNETIIVVEGELDALHPQVKGIGGMAATGGGTLSDEQLNSVIKLGVKRIILIPDNDTNGKTFTENNIKAVSEKGMPVFVATLPEGEVLSNGTEIHDVDEYLQAHNLEELQSLIDNAVTGSYYLYQDLVQTAIKDNGGETLTPAREQELREKVITVANSTPDEVERDMILTSYAALFKVDGKQLFSKEALKSVADRQKAKEDALKLEQETNRAIKDAERLLKAGEVQKALQTMGDAADRLKHIGDVQKYGDLLNITSRQERIRRFKEKPEGLITSYQFEYGEHEESPLPFVLPSGALTILAAPTSHGKSTFLRNLAIDVARRYKDENNSVLYFTFEESEEDVTAQFTNTYIGKKLHAASRRHTQVDSIIDYYKTGQPKYIGGSNAEIMIDEFKRKELEFSTDYLDSGKIRIYYRDYDLETLIEALEYAVCNIPTKAIFIDYIQILRSQSLIRQPRAEQLKEICISLKDFSVKHKIPVILAAQLNREAATPFRMGNTQMAESSDIEKAANTIVCIWNSKFKPKLYGGKEMGKEEKAEEDILKGKDFILGTEGKLYAKITKIRGSRGVGMYSVFGFKGYAGKVIENYNPEQNTLFEDNEKISAF